MNFKERGYLSDPYRVDFSARVREVESEDAGMYAVYLDKTYFYPASGGQPEDHGSLSGKPVLEITESVKGVRHLIEAELKPGDEVEGHIDWLRRFDHMQQHSGQHLLSRVFLSGMGLKTVGFHLGARTCTIDLDGIIPAAESISPVEHRVNRLIWDNIPIEDSIVDRSGYNKLLENEEGKRGEEVRTRLPDGVEQVRIVEVAGIDLTTCCGTHCRSTGEIGLVKILGTEKVRNNCRIEFVCGGRALRDYSEKHGLLGSIALKFSTDWRELGGVIGKLSEENKVLRKDGEYLKQQLAGLKAAELAEPTASFGGIDLIKNAFEEAEVGFLRDTAFRIRESGGKVIIFGVRKPKPGLIFSCSTDVRLDMGEIMKIAAPLMGARGGGGRDFAQGGGGDGNRIEEALDEAERRITEALG